MSDLKNRAVLGILILFGIWWLIGAYVVSILFGGALATAFWPLLKRIEKYYSSFRFKHKRAASVLTLFLCLNFLGFLPFLFLGAVATRGILKRLEELKERDLLNPGHFSSLEEFFKTFPKIDLFLDRISEALNFSREEFYETAWMAVKSIGTWLGVNLGNALAQLPAYGIQGFFILIAFVLCLYEKERILHWIGAVSPVSKDETRRYALVWQGLCKAVLWASVGSGFVQAVTFGIAAWIAGVSNLAVLFLLVFLASFIPVIGAAPLTFGMSLYGFLFSGAWMGGCCLVGALIASVSDNFVRPIIMKEGSDLHPVAAFCGIIGGIQSLGFLGIFLGPLVMGLLVEAMKIYSQRRLSRL